MSSPSRWPRRLVLGLIGGAAADWCRPAAAQTQGAPRTVVEPERVDLGVVALGTDPVARFTIRNQGDAPLTLTAGRVASGLRVEHVDSPVAPGSSGEVRVRVETFRAGPSPEWTIPLTTNDPNRGTVILQVRADVRTYILVTPPTARFTYVQHEREGGTTHVVGAAGHADFRITRVSSPYPFLDVAFAEAAADSARPEGVDGKLWTVTVTIRRDAAVGPLAGNVVIETNHPNQPRAWLAVSGFVRPLFAVTPPTVSGLQVPALSAAPFASLTVTHFGEAAARITAVESSVPGLIGQVVEVTPGHRWRLQLEATPALRAGAFKGTVTLRTDRADVPAVVIPVAGQRAAVP